MQLNNIASLLTKDLAPELMATFKSLFSLTGLFHLQMCLATRILDTFFSDGDNTMPSLRALLIAAGCPAARKLKPTRDMAYISTLFGTITA